MAVKTSTWLGLATAALLLAPVAAHADGITVTFYSGDGQDQVTYDGVTSTPMDISGANSPWGDVNGPAGLAPGTAQWESFGQTGFNADDLPIADTADYTNLDDATAVFTRSLLVGGDGDFNLWVLADDSASVVLSGPDGYNNVLFAANDDQTNGVSCTGVTVSCTNETMGQLSLAGLDPGLYTLNFYVYQEYGSEFGVQYAGTYTDDPNPVPEPATMTLLGSGLIGLGMAARRRWAKNA